MFVPAWFVLGLAAYLTWTAFLWLVCVSGGEAIRHAEIGYERAALDAAHRLVAWAARHAAVVVVG